MPLIEIQTIDDPRIQRYRDLRGRPSGQRADTIVVEGRWLVERLLDSRLEVLSILGSRSAITGLPPQVVAAIPVYVSPKSMLSDIVGFRFHRGLLACGVPPPTRSPRELIPSTSEQSCVVVAIDLVDPENLGGIARSCRALGVAGLLLSRGCADPLARRPLRVSMGASLELPFAWCDRPEDELRRLQANGFRIVAAVAGDAATPLPKAEVPPRVALLLGNEGFGLPDDLLERCDERVTIPLQPGVDSLNVSVACGILLYHYCRPTPDR